jgi:hypothetical protein
VAAKSQHRPEERWLVIGAPSKGILTLKICWSLIIVDREVNTVLGSADDKAESASLYLSVGCIGERGRDVPILWVLQKFMLPMSNIRNRYSSPWCMEMGL